MNIGHFWTVNIYFLNVSLLTLVYITSSEGVQPLSAHLVRFDLQCAIELTSERFISFHVRQTAAEHISWSMNLSLPELCSHSKMRRRLTSNPLSINTQLMDTRGWKQIPGSREL